MGGRGPRTRVDTRYLIAYRDGAHRVIDHGVLVHEGDEVVFVGPSYDGPCDRVVDATDKVVAPGFVSTHTHMSGSPFDRSLREDVNNPFLWMTSLYECLAPIRDAMTADLARAALRASCVEVVRSGVTTVVELTAWADEAAAAAAEAGLRAYVGPYLRSAGWQTDGRSISYAWLEPAEERRLFERALAFVEERSSQPHALVRGLLAPAQVDTCTSALLREVADAARRTGAPVQIHAAQAVAEVREMLGRHGRTSIEFLDDVGLLSQQLTIGHCVFISGHSWLGYPGDSDRQLLARSGATVAHCPQVFLRNGQALESLPGYLRDGVRVSLGTDTCPQSMLLEMRLAAMVGKLMARDGCAVGAKDVFDAATLAGASSLGRDDIGRLAPGSRADFVSYRTDTANMSPMRDPIRNVVYYALPEDVDTVVIAGSTVLAGGEPTWGDGKAILDDLRIAASELWERLPAHHHAGRSTDQISPPSLAPW